jgi:hypothetical protein
MAPPLKHPGLATNLRDAKTKLGELGDFIKSGIPIENRLVEAGGKSLDEIHFAIQNVYHHSMQMEKMRDTLDSLLKALDIVAGELPKD